MAQYYEITMDTPFGRQSGEIRLASAGVRIEGSLSVLRHTEPFFGEQLADGSCRLFGSFVTSERAYRYRALGCMNESRIELTLYSDNGVFCLKGRAVQRAE